MGKSDPDKVTHGSTSFFGTGLLTVFSTTVHKGNETYTGYGFTEEEANQKAGNQYRDGEKDKK